MTSRRTRSVAETQRAGEEFAALLRPCDIVVLTGTLGAGKTAFTQGLAKGLGVLDRVTSPTFTLVREHVCSGATGIDRLHHADLYRTNSLDEIEDLTFEEVVQPRGVAVVEWGEMGSGLWPETIWALEIDVIDDDTREIRVTRTPSSERTATDWVTR